MTKCNGVDINATIVWSWIFDRMERERETKKQILMNLSFGLMMVSFFHHQNPFSIALVEQLIYADSKCSGSNF